MPEEAGENPGRDEQGEAFELPRALTFLTLGCYMVGLLVVNLDLARYGIWDVDLAKPQYVLVGVLWAVLNGLFIGWFIAALAVLEPLFKNMRAKLRPWYKAPLVILSVVLVAALYEAMVFGAMIWLPLFFALGAQSPSVLVIFQDFCVAIMAGFGALFLFIGAGRRFRWPSFTSDRPVPQPSRYDDTKSRNESLVFVPMGILFMLFAIGLYAASLYPVLSKTIGGGRPPSVSIVLDHPVRAVWPRGVWVSPDGRRVGPVALLLESGSTLTVGPPDQPATWYTSPGEPAPAIEINKSLIATVLNEWRPYMDDVLVAGGQDPKGAATSKTAFFKFPTTWLPGEHYSEPGEMAVPRMNFTATRIPEEDSIFVLLTGGSDKAAHVLASAGAFQHYKAGQTTVVKFSPLSMGMSVPRMDHSATLLPDNAVLIAGGRNDTGPLASAELFRRGTCCGGEYVSSFAPTGSMQAARYRHTATELIAHSGPLGGCVLIAGGIGASGKELRAAEIYDASSGIFASTGAMERARQGHTATLLKNGLVLVAGGSAAGAALTTAELFDPGTQTFRSTGAMHDARVGQTATLLDDGRVLIAGGRGLNGIVGTAELYDPQQGTFVQTGGLMTPRAEHTSIRLNDGSVLLAGGIGVDGKSLGSAEIFDAWTESFHSAGTMPFALSSAKAVLLHEGEDNQ
jgi:hypothetical protein